MTSQFVINEQFILDLDANEIRYKKQLTDSSFCHLKLEFLLVQILEQLSVRPSEVVCRQQFIQALWQNNANVGNPALTKAISKLRKLFKEELQLENVIETIPKKGYRLKAKVRPLIIASEQVELPQKGLKLSNKSIIVAIVLAYGLILVLRVFSHSFMHQMTH